MENAKWKIWTIIHDMKDNQFRRTLVMGILNVTPDSFSDGNQFFSFDAALAHARQMIADGADIIDIGGESSRPGSVPVSADEELRRVIPVIEALIKETDVPISIDTTKSVVARAALAAGASIVNDISALRFDYHIADEVAKAGARLVLMHSRGTPATMQRLPPVADIIAEIIHSLRASIAMAERRGVPRESIIIDPGIGFGKTFDQNLEIIAKLDQIIAAFPDLPLMIGTSRKAFLGHLLRDSEGNPAPPDQRLPATLATTTAAILKGASIIRVHDVRAASEFAQITDAVH
ncbi:MAG TPA: dihydropteroate synthase [Pyrinomonadaceae bacterium]|nr:dihydropteroate synthase [Pyrinomonadaceae bacterium]